MRFPLATLLVLAVAIHAQGRKPNVIFILTDDVGFGDLSIPDFRLQDSLSNIQIQTPHIAGLASDGAIFVNAYSEPICGPARFALLSGLGSARSPVRGNTGTSRDFELPSDMSTYTAAFKEAGYYTALVGKWGFNNYPTDFGFDEFYGLRSHMESHSCFPAYVYENREMVDIKYNKKSLYRSNWGIKAKCGVKSMNQFSRCKFFQQLATTKALSIIQEATAASTPFFLQISYTASHTCSWSSKMSSPHPLVSVAPFGDFPSCPLKRRGAPMNRLELNECRYKSLMENYLDKDIGRIVKLTQELGIERDTIIVFTTDNGPQNIRNVHLLSTFDSVGGLRGGKRSIYEGGIKIPIIVKWPDRVSAGSVLTTPVMMYDLHATFLQIARGDLNDHSVVFKDSHSFLPLLVGKPNKFLGRDVLYIEYCDRQVLNWGRLRKSPQRFCSYMLREGNYKLVFDHKRGKNRLFDIREDPIERNNLAKTEEALMLRMLEKRNELVVSLTDAGYNGGTSLQSIN